VLHLFCPHAGSPHGILRHSLQLLLPSWGKRERARVLWRPRAIHIHHPYLPPQPRTYEKSGGGVTSIPALPVHLPSLANSTQFATQLDEATRRRGSCNCKRKRQKAAELSPTSLVRSWISRRKRTGHLLALKTPRKPHQPTITVLGTLELTSISPSSSFVCRPWHNSSYPHTTRLYFPLEN
jgi:hypothetical protein